VQYADGKTYTQRYRSYQWDGGRQHQAGDLLLHEGGNAQARYVTVRKNACALLHAQRLAEISSVAGNVVLALPSRVVEVAHGLRSECCEPWVHKQNRRVERVHKLRWVPGAVCTSMAQAVRCEESQNNEIAVTFT
jgi:phosphopantothenate synthetase